MNELFKYLGLVFALAFLALTVYLYFALKISEVIKFYLRHSKFKSVKLPITPNSSGSETQANQDSDTFLLNGDQTTILNVAQNYATALLDAENTHSLSALNDNVEDFREDFAISSSDKVLFDKKK